MLLLVILWGFTLVCKVQPATMEDIGNLVAGPLWSQTRLSLSLKGLLGPIPPQLGGLTNLTYLDLSQNNLFGPIPAELGNLTSLTYLDLWDNKNLSGPIPPELSTLTRLTYLDLSFNNLSGPIPSKLSSLPNITTLLLQVNNLSGPIPPELGRLTNLSILGLAANNLSGPIPPPLFRQSNSSFYPGNSGLCCIGCTFSLPCTGNPPPAILPAPPRSPPPLPPLLPSPPIEPPTSLPPVLPPIYPPSMASPFILSPMQPPPLPQASPPSPPPSVGPIVGGVLAGISFMLALATLGFCLHLRKKRMSNQGPPTGLEEGGKDELQNQAALKQPAPIKRQERITFKQLQKATGNFNSANVIGRGSFGTVYKGVLADGSMLAVKRLETRPGRRDVEERSWKTEVEALGKVRHINLVPLLGVCAERGERLLFFDFFIRGSLDRRLHHSAAGGGVLTWGDRMNIARGVCQGLTYLHSHIRPPMVHRDIKAANILLTDGDPTDACIADFGLAHLVQDTGGKTSTMVKGTVPYMAPEYLHGGARFLSPKCDVYSFGMLSLELISGRPVVRQLESGVVERLLKVATDLVIEGRGLELVDPALRTAYNAEEARNYIHVALACMRSDPSARPTMQDVGSLLARASVVDASFIKEEIWESDESSAYLGSLGSSTAERPFERLRYDV
ncbi:hypothetical protein KFL_006710010 [Klebsormidium nitens]|uniref:Protein kinase domain-containing protein n=1 Tax=Klebsormidium nitens TaxID=105231 RepID=A0A1Y1INC2_KLENI|nr:hypothetical protein KFL_006710010 [Klebsormidium nitens]|eukprot:GAQ90671.1 hypothetical protein KFL_006710010 [Klebsormidium nitens]